MNMNSSKPVPAVHLDQVVFRYQKSGKRNILDGVSLDIPSGCAVLIMGSSGCGKSTLAAVMAGLYPENGGFLESGTIELFGKSLSSMNPQTRAGYLSMMFQNPDLQFCMNTLRKEMQFCLENVCVPASEMDSRIGKAAEALGVDAFLDRDLHTLSGGEKQKAVLACLYVMESQCIVLDECFANIDEDAAGEIVRLLENIRREGRTIIAIDHKADLWMDLADQIILLGEGGRTAAEGITRENIGRYREIFEKEGVYFPKEYIRRSRAEEDSGGNSGSSARSEDEVILRFRNLSVPREPEQKKHFLLPGRKRPEKQDLLLENAEARFYKGRIHAVLGKSGCGKTSTFLAVLKQHPYAGTIEVDGKDIASMRRREIYQKIGIVFQNPANQFITQNVEQEVRESLKIWEPDLPEEDCARRADELLETFGLGRFRKYSPYMLSQGQQRRLAVLSVLACGQKILLLDEPTYGQDAASTAAIMDLLSRKTEQEGLTVIFITHDRSLAEEWADHVYEAADGKLTAWERRSGL